jgi:hypothetical protein
MRRKNPRDASNGVVFGSGGGRQRATSRKRSLLMRTVVFIAVGVLAVVSCGTKPELPLSGPKCPNAYPQAGASCQLGLACHYFDPAGCDDFLTATCDPGGHWQIDSTCSPVGAGGAGGSSSASTGGSGGCVDPVEGPPKVVSPAALALPPDGGASTYTLTFNEPVLNPKNNLAWDGPGEIVSVSAAGATSYVVRFTGMTAGDHATLTLKSATSACGKPLAAPFTADIDLLQHCHLLAEDFEGDFFASGWSTNDLTVGFNEWARNDDLDPPNGVPNHTQGFGSSASANDTGSFDEWDAVLLSPTMTLTAGKSYVVHYESAFGDELGKATAALQASSDGTQWTTLTSWTGDRPAHLEHVDVSSFAGGPLHLRWRFSEPGPNDAYFDVDDVCVEEYTKPSCPCPAGGITELKDVLGKTDGNATFASAEATFATLATVGQDVTVCGRLEDATASGDDMHSFSANIGGGPLIATVTYCVENAFEDATLAVVSKSDLQSPLASLEDARGKGSFKVKLTDPVTHFVTLAATAPPYASSRYSIQVKVTGTSTVNLSEGFESWPPQKLTPTLEGLCLKWQQATQTVVPLGGFPPEGFYLAYLNSYNCPSGSQSLVSAALNFVGKTEASIAFDMYHDTTFPELPDAVQVEYEVTANNWATIGAPIERPAAVAGWVRHTVDMSVLAGKPAVRIRLRGIGLSGGDIHLDNVVVLSD